MKLGIVNSCEFCGDPSVARPFASSVFSEVYIFVCLFIFLHKVDVQVSLSFLESQTENYLIQVIMIITFAEI